jgi:hypothetical protein
MPYIKQPDRIELIQIEEVEPQNAGELNYCITRLVQLYFARIGGRYQQINDVLGALEGAKLEFYRRLAAPYEDTKIKENGDVYHNVTTHA